VEPLPAALHLLESRAEDTNAAESEGGVPHKKYKPVVYGEFLMKKVSNNFAGKGKYA